MKKLISLILVFCMAVILVPALAESADIVGEWTADYSGYSVVLTLNANGTFSMEVAGMGGAMDLCVGCPEVIITMLHTQKGNHKIKKACTLPLTAEKCVTDIITEMAVMKVTDEGIVVTELHPDYTKEEVQEATGVDLIWSPDLKPYDET